MKNKLFTIALVLIFMAGLSLLLYPTVSNAYNSWLHSKIIVEYAQQVDKLEQEVYDAEWKKADDYNAQLHNRDNPFALPETMQAQYQNTLALADNGIMAYIEIPSIDVTLPIAHGTTDEVLSRYVGHIEWSSLPIGGENTHSVISGHRGLPSSELFTNIDHLELGDRFYIHVLGKTLEYRVCNIAAVEPEDQSLLRTEEGKDLITLVTCTPYGINSHRLLVQAIRTGSGDSISTNSLYVKNEITQIDPVILVSVILVSIAVAVFVVLLLGAKKKRKEMPTDETPNS